MTRNTTYPDATLDMLRDLRVLRELLAADHEERREARIADVCAQVRPISPELADLIGPYLRGDRPLASEMPIEEGRA